MLGARAVYAVSPLHAVIVMTPSEGAGTPQGSQATQTP